MSDDESDSSEERQCLMLRHVVTVLSAVVPMLLDDTEDPTPRNTYCKNAAGRAHVDTTHGQIFGRDADEQTHFCQLMYSVEAGRGLV